VTSDKQDCASLATALVTALSAAEQIVAEAEKYHADLLVIGVQPRSLLGTVLLGSTTELVIRSAPCPVLSVRGKK